MDSLHSLEWCDTEICKVSSVEGHIPALRIGVAFLAGLCNFQAVSDHLDLFVSLSNYIWAKHLAFSGFKKVERGATLTSIEGFKGCHLKAGLIVVVRELGEGKTFLPLGSIC
jgi:hypothetical protein